MQQPDRHHRQRLLPEVGDAGQQRLRAAHALVVGCGALGTTAAELLCRAGVGALTIVDRDLVEWTNLQRQTLFDETDARTGAPKATAAKRRLAAIDPAVNVTAVVDDCNARTAPAILPANAGVILDCTDNYETRYLLNDLAVSRRIPLVYAGAVGTGAMTMTVLPHAAAGAPAPPWSGRETPCLRCVFDEPPPPEHRQTCDTAGVLGPAASLIASAQAAEAIKILLGAWDAVSRALTRLDLWLNRWQRVDLSGAARPDCACCGAGSFQWLAATTDAGTTTICGRESVQILPGASANFDLGLWAERLAPHGQFTLSDGALRGALAAELGDDGEPLTLTLFPNGRAIIGGAGVRRDAARSVYARYIGA